MLKAIHSRYPSIELRGLEYFEWAKKHAPQSIVDRILLLDLSRQQDFHQKFAIVNCTEVGEHIPKSDESVFIENITKLSGDILVLGWSDVDLGEGHQHLNPQSTRYIRERIVAKGFDIWNEATEDLKVAMMNERKNGAYDWWWKPLTVYRRRRFLTMDSSRFVQGTATDSSVPDLLKPYLGGSLQRQVIQLKDLVLLHAAKKLPLSILRFGDGDFYFVNSIEIGSAKPGNRAIRVSYSEKINLPDCRKGMLNSDIICPEINSIPEGGLRLMLLLHPIYFIARKYFRIREHQILQNSDWMVRHQIKHRILVLFAQLLKNKLIRLCLYPIFALSRKALRLSSKSMPILEPFPFAFEAIYALVSSRIIFRLFPNEILLVGQTEKIEAIKILMESKEYRDYLGVNNFCGYVGVEKIGAADNEEILLASIEKTCSKISPKVILVGMGSAKLYALSRIKRFSDAVVIDVGAGIDAMAGVISRDRPYFAEWVNFRSQEINYEEMDLMDSNNPNRDSEKYTSRSV